uniref:(northern house mosquito) hypothetical protein n=1 Tax=Culex pipiens TaxID=7175 RepID=A0A8D8BRH5_CULPI
MAWRYIPHQHGCFQNDDYGRRAFRLRTIRGNCQPPLTSHIGQHSNVGQVSGQIWKNCWKVYFRSIESNRKLLAVSTTRSVPSSVDRSACHNRHFGTTRGK